MNKTIRCAIHLDEACDLDCPMPLAQPAPDAPCIVCGYLRDSGTHDTAETCDEVHGPCLDPQRHHPYQPAQPAPDALRAAAQAVVDAFDAGWAPGVGVPFGRNIAALRAALGDKS